MVKVIRGTSHAPAPSKPKTPAPEPKHQIVQEPDFELNPIEHYAEHAQNISDDDEVIHNVVNQASRTQFSDFTEHNSRHVTKPDAVKRLARGPHFPMAFTLRLASLFYLLGRLGIVASLGSLVWFTFTDQKNYFLIAPLLAATLLFTFIAWGMSNGLRCRVCIMPFLSKRKCKMNKKAPKLPFISHHLTAALYILSHNHLRCPYCGTVNRLKQ